MLSEIKTIGVIGAGQMGVGIAHVCAAAGHDVRIFDISAEALGRARDSVEKNMDRQVARGRLTDQARDQALARIATSTEPSSLGDCDLVIEAATENEDVKKQVYARVCPVLKKEAILASNNILLLKNAPIEIAAQIDQRFLA